jgi:very-short-patch-repair endonuclease
MNRQELSLRFLFIWKALGGPVLTSEHRFHSERKWRFDFCIPEKKVAVELEGGIWVKGAHTRGSHFNSDCEKYNNAALLGWRVFRITTNMIGSKHLEPIIKELKS